MVLALPRGGRQAPQLVHTYLSLFRNGEWGALLARNFSHIGERTLESSDVKRAQSLARVGYMSGAMRALNAGALADTSDDQTYSQLKALHPAASRQIPKPILSSSDALDESLFFSTLFKSPYARAPDAAGWRGDYFKDLDQNGKEHLFKLARHILKSPKLLPKELLPFLFGARLMAVKKSNGGIGPIAIGTILRKIIKCYSFKHDCSSTSGTFLPLPVWGWSKWRS